MNRLEFFALFALVLASGPAGAKCSWEWFCNG